MVSVSYRRYFSIESEFYQYVQHFRLKQKLSFFCYDTKKEVYTEVYS